MKSMKSVFKAIWRFWFQRRCTICKRHRSLSEFSRLGVDCWDCILGEMTEKVAKDEIARAKIKHDRLVTAIREAIREEKLQEGCRK